MLHLLLSNYLFLRLYKIKEEISWYSDRIFAFWDGQFRLVGFIKDKALDDVITLLVLVDSGAGGLVAVSSFVDYLHFHDG